MSAEKNKLIVLRHKNLLLIFRKSFPGNFTEKDIEFFYNENTCPINFLFAETDGIVIDLENRDPDPHGVFKFVESLEDVDLELKGMEDSEILEAFRELIDKESKTRV